MINFDIPMWISYILCDCMKVLIPTLTMEESIICSRSLSEEAVFIKLDNLREQDLVINFLQLSIIEQSECESK